MEIVILGAGAVGSTLADLLAKESEENDITIIDANPSYLSSIEEHADIKTIQGHCSHPDVLVKAGIQKADIVVAVSGSDEINLVACLIAKTLSANIRTIARIRDASYAKKDTKGAILQIVDKIISPEQLLTDYIQRLIDTPGSLQVLDFANGKLNLVGVKAVRGGPLIGHHISDLKKHMPKVDTRIAAIFRQDQAVIPSGDTIIEAGDEVFFIAKKNDISSVINEMRKKEDAYKRIMIAGGGKVGSRLAKAIEHNHQVKVIETNKERAKYIAGKLESTIVLHGDSSDKLLLHEENIESMDVFASLTNDDEANIMSCLLAKEMGAHKLIALINNPAYVDLVQGKGIDIAIAPSQITIGTLLAEVAGEGVETIYSLRRGAAEAIETIVKKNKDKEKCVIGKRLGEVLVPDGVTIGAIMHDNYANIAHHDTIICENDHLILFLTDKSILPEIKSIFSP
ncbi:MAG: Trk system potassium transporter TrkA [SAR86 cluster bacterium]|nr:Trk system potassium transporter TrkA [SAR86 cluster bacterium]